MGRIGWAAMVAVIALLCVELMVRFVTAVPLHHLGPEGYIHAPNQRGSVFLRRYAYNELSMGVEQPFVPEGVLLLGDSIVNGGTLHDQPERLGPQLEERIGRDVWPVSAGGWGLANQLAYIKARPEVLQLDTIVFVLNATDSRQGEWLGEVQMPTKRPILAMAFAYDRWIAKKKAIVYRELPPWKPEWEAFLRRYKGRVVVVGYPIPDDMNQRTDPLRWIRNMAPEVIEVPWSAEYYEQGVHPGPEGTALLAEIIAGGLARPSQVARR